jgi:hypothetical protein
VTAPTVAGRYLGYRPDQWADEWHRFLLHKAIDDTHTPAGRALVAALELHAPINPYPTRDQWAERECQGDDMSGHDAEDPDWPCRTVYTIATTLGHPIERACPHCSASAVELTRKVWPDGALIAHLVYPPYERIRPADVRIVNGRIHVPRTAGHEPYLCPATGTIIDPTARPAEPLAITEHDRTQRPTP